MKNKKFKKKYIFFAILAVILIVVIVFASIWLFRVINGKRVVISVNGIEYTQNDYMMYLRLTKNKLFDEDTTRLPKATLNTLVDEEKNINTEQYLRSKTEENLKIAGSIEKIASDNDIKLSDEDIESLNKEKADYINKLGGKFKFAKFLYDNRTTEEAYDKISRLNKLYDKVYEELYAANKKKDLTEKEVEDARTMYNTEYMKARQIFLVTVDPTTKKDLSNSVIEQKKLLASAIKNELNENSDFNEYIKKYSDDAVDKEPPYDMYFKSGQMIKEIEDTVKELEIGEISDIVKSDYGYHIIKRDELDEGYFQEYLNSMRENKFLTDIYNTIKECKIIIQDSFTTLRVD